MNKCRRSRQKRRSCGTIAWHRKQSQFVMAIAYDKNFKGESIKSLRKNMKIYKTIKIMNCRLILNSDIVPVDDEPVRPSCRDDLIFLSRKPHIFPNYQNEQYNNVNAINDADSQFTIKNRMYKKWQSLSKRDIQWGTDYAFLLNKHARLKKQHSQLLIKYRVCVSFA